jgi:hypothetical protein
VGGRLTNASGEFTFAALRKGVYVLVVRAIGYRPVRQRVLVGELSAFLDIGTLPMTREALKLGEVVVSAGADGRSAAMERQTIIVATTSASRAAPSCRRCPPCPACRSGRTARCRCAAATRSWC